MDGVARRHRELVAALPDRVDVHYALKANGSLAIAARLADVGCGVDVCSRGELAVAAAAGFPGVRTLFTGPGKSDHDLHEAVARGLRWVVVESVGEARRLAAVATAAGRRQPVLVRIAPRTLPSGDGLVVAVPGGKFGVDEEEAAEALATVAALPGLRLEGIHVYAESCVLDAGHMLAINTRTIALARDLAAHDLPITVVDLGGGLGVPYGPDEPAFDLARWSDGLRSRCRDLPADWRLVVEPGRFLVAEHGTYVVTVLDVKTVAGRRHVIVDGGINQLYRPNMARANRQVEVLGASGQDGPTEVVAIAGPLLSGEDVLATDVELPRIDPGRRLAFRSCGAYGYGHGISGFSAHPTPAEVAIEPDGSAWEMRRRGRPSAALRDQSATPSATPERTPAMDRTTSHAP
nr:alanine racemase [Salsipaludibacter albus]